MDGTRDIIVKDIDDMGKVKQPKVKCNLVKRTSEELKASRCSAYKYLLP